MVSADEATREALRLAWGEERTEGYTLASGS